MADLHLTVEQETEAVRIAKIVSQKTQDETLQIARLLVSRSDGELFGKTEFEVRDLVHRIGACAFETALEERKKGGTKARASHARTARSQPDS
jgi:hypothetical protein